MARRQGRAGGWYAECVSDTRHSRGEELVPHIRHLVRGPARRRTLGLLLILILAGGATGFIGRRLLDQGYSSVAAPVSAGIPGWFVLPTSSPAATPALSPRPSSAPSARPTPAPSPPIQATPAPTAVTAAAHPAALNPAQTVATWYRYVADGAFDNAYALWSDAMRSDFPRQSNLDGRWDDTAQVTVNQLYVAEQTASTAKVQVDFIETKDSGATRRFVGWWDLALIDGRWLLDHPNF